MKLSYNYTVALQTLLIAYHYSDEKITSNFIARKIGADPVVVRNVMANLKNAGFIDCKPGPGGLKLTGNINKITLYDVYKTINEDDEDEKILKFYKLTYDSTDFEEKIISTTDNCFSEYINSFFNELKAHTVADIYNKI